MNYRSNRSAWVSKGRQIVKRRMIRNSILKRRERQPNDPEIYVIKKSGIYVDESSLKVLEEVYLMSEEEIADYYGICRKTLYNIRKKKGWLQVVRSDKGRQHYRRKDSTPDKKAQESVVMRSSV